MRLLPISLVPRPLRAQSPAPSFRDPKRLSSALEPFSTAAPPWPDLEAPHRPRWPAARQDRPQGAFRPLDASLPVLSAGVARGAWLRRQMAHVGSASRRPDSRYLADSAMDSKP